MRIAICGARLACAIAVVLGLVFVPLQTRADASFTKWLESLYPSAQALGVSRVETVEASLAQGLVAR